MCTASCSQRSRTRNGVSPANIRVLVLGAGMAGLVAAHALERHGHPVEIIEASTRVGGRVHTHRFGNEPDAPAVELGAMRIPAHHRHTLDLVDRLDLAGELRPFTTLLSDDNAYLWTSAGPVRVGDAAVPLREDFRRELATHGPASRRFPDPVTNVGAWLTLVIDAVAPPDLREALRGDLRGPLLDLVGRVDLRPHLRGAAGERVDLKSLFAAHPGLRAACSGRLNSFLDDILTETGPELLRLHGGMDRLPHALLNRIQGPVHLGREVTGIAVRPDGVLVRAHARSGPSMHHADFAVCTLPFTALRRMPLAGLDTDKLAVIDEVDYCPATKVAFHCREPFWRTHGIEGGASFTGGRIRQTYYPPADAPPGQGAALLASYTIGDEATWLGLLPPRLRHRVVLDELAVFHPELRLPGMVLDAVSTAWGNGGPAQAGCTTRWGKSPNACEAERARAARPVHRLFFAGEHCSTAPAWIEGAIESALAAVDDLVRHRAPRRASIDRQDTPGGPR